MSTIESDALIAATGTNTALSLRGKGTGKVSLGDANLLVPDADGAAGQIVTTDGSANLVFAATPGSSGNLLTSNGSAWTSAAAASGGKVVSFQSTSFTSYSSVTAARPGWDDTAVLYNEMNGLGTTVTFTPASATNILWVAGSFAICLDGGTELGIGIVEEISGVRDVKGFWVNSTAGDDLIGEFSVVCSYVCGTTSLMEVQAKVGSKDAGTVYLNGTSAGRLFGGISKCQLCVMEISPN